MTERVAVVTGANRGIGYEVVRGLCQRYSGVVYLTARDTAKGKAAVAKLEKEGLHPRFHQLDVTDRASLQRFKDFLTKEHGGINVLVNNAGYYDVTQKYTNYAETKKVIDINYTSMKLMDEYFYPLMRPYGRIILVSSLAGHLCNLKNEHWLKVFSKNEITVEEIDAFVQWHLDAVKNGTFKKEDFVDDGIWHALRVSKMAVSALAAARQAAALERQVSVNAVEPGLVRTDSSRGAGQHDAAAGAQPILYMATIAPHDTKGQFVRHDRVARRWNDLTQNLVLKYFDLFKS